MVRQLAMTAGATIIEMGRALLDAFEPLERHLATSQSFAVLLKRHGWRVEPDDLDLSRIRPVFEVMVRAAGIGRLVAAARDADDARTAGLASAMLDALQGIPAAVIHLGRQSRRPASFPFSHPAFWEEFPRELLDELIVDHFALHRPVDYAPLVLADLFVEEIIDVRGATGRCSYSRRKVRWGRLREELGATSP